MRAGVRLIDLMLRKSGGIFEFSQDAECILRLQLRRAPHSVVLGDVSILKGDPVLALHMWNERVPRISGDGVDFEWAFHLRRCLVHSFKGIAQAMQADLRYTPVCALCGASALFSFSDHIGGARMMQRFGFTILPYHQTLGRFGEFWENLFSWWLMWTYNNKSLNSRNFWRLLRTEIWITRDEFLRRFGS